jgi:hypothetical protein
VLVLVMLLLLAMLAVRRHHHPHLIPILIHTLTRIRYPFQVVS